MPDHSQTSEQMPDYVFGAMSKRLRQVFITALCGLFLLLITSALAISHRLSERREYELLQQYQAALSKLDTDLYQLERAAFRVLNTGNRDGIPAVLANSESIWLDFDALLGQREAELHIDPPISFEEHQMTMMHLRTSLLDSLILLRGGQVDSAVKLFESRPSLYIEQMHHSVQVVRKVTSEHLEQHRDQSARARLVLITSYFTVVLVTLFLFLRTLLRVGRAATQLEDDLNHALDKVSSQQKLSTLGRVAGTISHELRNPLGTIRTSVYSLGMREECQSPEARRILDRIERNILRCDAIVASLLDYMREFRIHKRPVNLLQWTLQLLSEQELPVGIELKLPDQDVGDVAVDSELLRRAYLNVITNACQAITAVENERERKLKGTLEISLLPREGQVGIEFRDDGPGISAENLDRVFEPLFSTRSFGIGLGMLIVQQIMEQHAGSVVVESQLHEGTRVTLWLPLDQ